MASNNNKQANRVKQIQPYERLPLIKRAIEAGNLAEWKCRNCGYLFGLIEEGVLSIKAGDKYFWFKSGEVTAVCRSCSTMQSISLSEEQNT